ncbi:cadherin repeat domain-containing protein [Ferrimonas balearica]|uniref:cadherin repeat domain-containing protein n=1 Tax=Ferrimonas balearica TaxID=44012 RepID=UPI001C5A320C|nr:cadherin repeat domain-containing protein [Ferrimonas balearica]MBW3163110.1 hypothetical protein [Ferrimonas balearica]
MRTNRRFLLAAWLVLLITGCGGGSGDEGSSTTEPPITTPPEETVLLPHPGLTAPSVTAQYQPERTVRADIEGQKGTLSFELAPGSADDVVEVDPLSGQLRVLNQGDATILVRDSGSPNYKAAEAEWLVTITPGARGQLLTNDLTLSFGDNPTSLRVSGAIGQLHYQPMEPQPVIAIDESGRVTALAVGTSLVHIEDDGGRNYQSSSAAAFVRVVPAQGEAAQFQDLDDKPYVPGGTLLPSHTGALAKQVHYVLDDTDSEAVIRLDQESGEMSILGAGDACVRVEQNNGPGYETLADQRFCVTILPAENTGLVISEAPLAFEFDGIVDLPVSSVQGTLTLTLADDAPQDVLAVTNDQRLALLAPGEVRLNVKDDGGRNYLPNQRTVTVTVLPLPHPGLSAINISRPFDADARWIPAIQGARGELSYRLVKEQDAARVRLDPVSGTLTPLMPGQSTIQVCDDGGRYYAPTNTQFTLTVEKLDNEALAAKPLVTQYQPNQQLIPEFEGVEGSLTLSLLDGQDVVTINPDNSLTTLKSGYAVLRVLDSGNDWYQPAETQLTVTVYPADSPMEAHGLTLSYAPDAQGTLSVIGAVGTPSFAISHGSDQDVVAVDPHTGIVTVLNAGTTNVTVTDPGDAKTGSYRQMVTVTVNKGAANPNLKLASERIQGVYGQLPLEAPPLSGVEPDAWVSYWIEDAAQRQIAQIDSRTGVVTPLQAGIVEVTVTEHSRNYEDSQVQYQAVIELGQHDGLRIDDTTPTHLAFYPDMRIAAPVTDNQYGKLHFSATPSEDYELTDDGSLVVHRQPLLRTISVIVEDDGGNKVTPSLAQHTFYLDHIDRDTGNPDTVTFEGGSQLFSTEIEIMKDDHSRLSLASGNDFGTEVLLPDGSGYTRIRASTTLESSGQRVPVTLRLSTRGDCQSPGQWLPLSTPMSAGCSGSQQVRIIMVPEDDYNAALPSGRYLSDEPLVLTQRAKPWVSGGVTEMGEEIARKWWLIDIDMYRQ